jgi:uroporphyrinogen-III synthase
VPEGAERALREALAGGIDAVALTSPSTVEHLFALLTPKEADELARRARFACIGPTTAEALRSVRPEVRFETAARPAMGALVEALERAFPERG